MYIFRNIFVYLIWMGIFLARKLRSSLYRNKGKSCQNADTAPEIETALEEFIAENHKMWERYQPEASHNHTDQYILIESICSHPGYAITNLVIGKHLMNISGLKGVGLLLERNAKLEKLFNSYGITEIYYLSDKNDGIFYTFRAAVRAFAMLTGVNDGDDLLKMKIDGIDIGRIVYDDYLRRSGIGTVEKITTEIFEGLVRAILEYQYISALYERNNIKSAVYSEIQFIPWAVIFQCALKRGIKVYTRGGGPTKFTIRRYENLEQRYMDRQRYGQKLYDYVYENFKDKAIEEGRNFIISRFEGNSGANDIRDARQAFHGNKIRLTRKELCEKFGWDPSKRIAVIMANVLTDGVFTNRWRLFRDNLQWLRNTLQAARNITNVNWLVKSHPSDKRYEVKTTTLDEYKKYLNGCPHTAYLPENILSYCLPEVVDVVVTAHGTAGIEYPIFGKQCIVGGEAFYSGLGFTYEPKTKEEYFELLKNIHLLNTIEKSQSERACIFAYIYLILSRVETCLTGDFGVTDAYDEVALWKSAAKRVKTANPFEDRVYKMLKIQVENNFRHMLNYDLVTRPAQSKILKG